MDVQTGELCKWYLQSSAESNEERSSLSPPGIPEHIPISVNARMVGHVNFRVIVCTQCPTSSETFFPLKLCWIAMYKYIVPCSKFNFDLKIV